MSGPLYDHAPRATFDADRGTAQLAVGIRTFWTDRTASGGPLRKARRGC